MFEAASDEQKAVILAAIPDITEIWADADEARTWLTDHNDEALLSEINETLKLKDAKEDE